MEAANKQSHLIDSILDSTTEIQVDYSKERQELQERLQAVIAENSLLQARVNEYAGRAHECSNFKGYDEFYVRTLIQQKDYFEKEVKLLIEVISQKEAETNQLIQQYEHKIAEVTDECEHWKQKVTELERRISENHFFETKRLEGFQLDLDLKNQEINDLKLEMNEREASLNSKIASLSAELEQLHSVHNFEESVIDLKGRKTSDFLPSGKPPISPLKRADRSKSPAAQGRHETDLSVREQLLDESMEGRMNCKRKDYSSRGEGSRSHEYSKDVSKAEVLNIMLMIEIDRLHAIIDELGALIDSSSLDYRVLRD